MFDKLGLKAIKPTHLSALTFCLVIAAFQNSRAEIFNDITGPVAVMTDDDAVITNNRDLDASDVRGGYIAMKDGYKGNATINNNGSITYTNDTFGAISSIYLGNRDQSQTITVNNNGAITTTGADASAVYFAGDISDPKPFNYVLNNSGTMNSSTRFGTNYIYMYDNQGNFAINNSGTIANSAGPALVAVNGNSVEITNSGILQADSPAGYAISNGGLGANNMILNVMNGSTIIGKIEGSNKTGAVNDLNIYQSAISVTEYDALVGQLVNSWTINLKEGSHLVVNSGETFAPTDFSMGGGNLVVNGTLATTALISSGSTLSGVGTVSDAVITSGGAIAPGNSIGTINVTRNLTLESGSNSQVEFNNVVMDQILVGGNATISGNANFKLSNTAPSGYFVVTQNIIQTGGTVSGRFENVSADNNFAANVNYGSNFVSATVAKKIGSDVLDVAILAQNSTSRILSQNLSRQLLSTEKLPEDKITAWISGSGFNNKMDARKTSAEFSSSGILTSVGLASNHGDYQITGGIFNSLTYAKRKVYTGKDDLNTTGLMVGVGKNYGDFYGFTQIGAGFYNFDTRRDVNVNGAFQSAKADGRGNFQYLNLGGSYKIPTNFSGETSAFASATIQRTTRNGFNESGLDTANLSVDKLVANTLNFELGAAYKNNFYEALRLPNDSFYRIEVSGYQSNLIGKKNVAINQGDTTYAIRSQYKQNLLLGLSGSVFFPLTEISTISAKLDRKQNSSFNETIYGLYLDYKF